MRKTLIICIGLMFTMKGFGQVYHPIPLDSVYWVEEFSGPYLGGSDCIEEVTRLVYPTQNTAIVGGKEYQEFRCTELWEFFALQPGCPAPFVSSNMFYAFIRNDSLNKKVFLYDTNDTHQEVLLYDFDISVGDTIVPSNGYGPVCPSDTLTVQSIDSVDIGGEYRKRFEITFPGMGWGSIYLIEGVGSSLGFVDIDFCPFEYNTDLVCYHYKNLAYGAISSGYCIPNLGMESIVESKKIIFPNSPNNYFISNTDNNSIQVTCYDMLGKFMLGRSFHESGYLDVSEFTSGVYFMYITLDNLVIKPYKFVVQH